MLTHLKIQHSLGDIGDQELKASTHLQTSVRPAKAIRDPNSNHHKKVIPQYVRNNDTTSLPRKFSQSTGNYTTREVQSSMGIGREVTDITGLFSYLATFCSTLEVGLKLKKHCEKALLLQGTSKEK